jgi:hypothetical protein
MKFRKQLSVQWMHIYIYIYIYIYIAQPVHPLTMYWTVLWSNPGGGEIFRTRPDRPWCPPNSLYIVYWVRFPTVRSPGRVVDHPHLSSAKVNERVYTPTPLLGLHGLSKVQLYKYTRARARVCVCVCVCVSSCNATGCKYVWMCLLMGLARIQASKVANMCNESVCKQLCITCILESCRKHVENQLWSE